jgi:hypothetical protein
VQVLGQSLAWRGRGRGRRRLVYPPFRVTYEHACADCGCAPTFLLKEGPEREAQRAQRT